MGGPTTRQHTCTMTDIVVGAGGGPNPKRMCTTHHRGSLTGEPDEPLFSEEEEEGLGAAGAGSRTPRPPRPTPHPAAIPADIDIGGGGPAPSSSTQLRGELVQSGIDATMGAIVAFAEGLFPIVARTSRGEPAAPHVRSNTKQPSAFEIELVMLPRPAFMPLSIADAPHKVSSFWRQLLLTSPAPGIPKARHHNCGADVYNESGARKMLIDHLDLCSSGTGTEWVSSAFSHWALQQVHIFRGMHRLRRAVMQSTGQVPEVAPAADIEEALVARLFGGDTNRRAMQRAANAFLSPYVINFHLDGTAPGVSTADAGSRHKHGCQPEDELKELSAGCNTGTIGVNPRHSELPTWLKGPMYLGPSKMAEGFFKLFVAWRYEGFRACANAHNKSGISPAKLFHGEGERQMLVMELKRRGLSAKFKSVQLGKVPPHCLRPSLYPYFGQPCPRSKEALRLKMPLLTISWAAGLETSIAVEDQNDGSYLDLAEDEEDL